MTYEKVILFVHTGPRADEQHEVPVNSGMLIGDLVTGWRRDFGLREQDADYKLITYGLFMNREGKLARLDDAFMTTVPRA
ncbi:MAG: hypothetical protein HGB28_04720, partial [Oscillochloris sp.]|nr:hypothetical protein [Oscillochloris sp.]